MQKSASDFRRHEIGSAVTFSDTPGGLVRLNIATPLAEAHVYLHGGHVTHFQPAEAAPVLFLSDRSHFAAGKAIRGGVPVCFPWFGPRAGAPSAPMHGFARTMDWDVESVRQDGEEITVVLALAACDATRAQWSHDFVLRHHITVGTALRMVLEVENRSSEPFTIEEALHTYLAVADVRAVSVAGLEGASYLDKTDGFKTKTLDDQPLRFTDETDRVFPNHRAACVVEDGGAGRRIVVEKSGSETTVVWNPWTAKAAAMADFGDDEWTKMLCIETANTGVNAVSVGPGARHEMTAIVRL